VRPLDQNQGAKVGGALVGERAQIRGSLHPYSPPGFAHKRSPTYQGDTGRDFGVSSTKGVDGLRAPAAYQFLAFEGEPEAGRGPPPPGDRELPEGRAAAPDVGGGNRTHYRRRRATQATLTRTAENTSKSSSRSAECKAR